MFARALRRAPVDYHVEEARTAEEAYERLQREHFHVVILDHGLPTKPGTWLLEQLQPLGDAKPAVIVATGSYAEGLNEAVHEAGAHDYCAKDTLTSVGLQQAIHNALARRRVAARLDRLAERQNKLFELTSKLSRLARLADIFECLTRYSRSHVGACGGGLFKPFDAEFLASEGSFGARASSEVAVARLPRTARTPVAVAAQSGQVLIVRSPEEVAEQFPFLIEIEPDTHAAVGIPCMEGNELIAVLGMRFDYSLDDDAVSYLQLFAKVAADAIRRAELYERLRRQSLFEQRLLAVVGHDLRTPLSIVEMGVDMLEEDLDVVPDKLLPQLGRAVRQMSHILGDIGELTRARSGQLLREMALDELELGVLLEELLEDLNTRFPARFAFQRPNEAMRVRGAAERLRQVFENLASNAVKYGAADRPVTLSLSKESGQVIAEVHNWGRAIPTALQAVMFQPFTGERRGIRSGESLGLGLYIVREIVEGHGGAVSVQSVSELGTTFNVRLPLVD